MSSRTRRRTSLAVSAAAALWALAGCHGGTTNLAPAPTSLSPASGSTSSDTSVAIAGDRFPVQATQSARGAEGNAVDATYRAWLGDTELQGVAWLDERCLEGTVPAGLAPGVYNLRVVGPDGAESQLDAAFTVRPAGASPDPSPTSTPTPTPTPGSPAPAGIPSLLATATAPNVGADYHVGNGFSLVLSVRNTGTVAASAVKVVVNAAGTGAVAGNGAATAPVDIAAGGSATLSAPYRASSAGLVKLTATAIGTDPGTGRTVSAPPVVVQVKIEPPETVR